MSAMFNLVALMRHGNGNDLDALIQEVLLPEGFLAIDPHATIVKLIDRSFEDEARYKGETISVPRPIVMKPAEEHPTDGTPTTSQAINTSKSSLILNKQPFVQWSMTEREALGSLSKNIIPGAVKAGFRAMGSRMTSDVFSMYREVYSVCGDPTSTNSRTKDDLGVARTAFLEKNILGPKNMVLNPVTEGSLAMEFSKINESGDTNLVREGALGRKLGFDMFVDAAAPMHIAGTASLNNGITLATPGFAGSDRLNLDGVGASTFKHGDIVSIAGYDQTHVVTADATGAVVTIAPALLDAIPSGAAVTVMKSHRVDLAFQPEAFSIAFRPLESPASTEGVKIYQMTDPVTGFSLRLSTHYDMYTHNTTWKLDTLYGIKCFNPELALRFGGH
ncbi:P22 phage major capsid protein family protein [Pseudomonas shirazensis]|uniref:P22 phage major capsid protein family protein n=1 Tax=Pseudomonas shirazensis TaxID=2745494 RepID=UPI003D2B0B31